MTVHGATRSFGPGWRNVWLREQNPAFSNKERLLNVAITNDSADGPQGTGFASVQLTPAGLSKSAATLADGRKATCCLPVSPTNAIPVYSAIPYAGGGSLSALLETDMTDGYLQVAAGNQTSGRWIKLAPSEAPTGERSFPGGFDLGLTISGAEHRSPASGELLFGNRFPPCPLTIELVGGGIETVGALSPFKLADTVSLLAELQRGNKVALKLPAEEIKASTNFSTATGRLAGSLVVTDPLVGKVTIPFEGLYIPDLQDSAKSAITGFHLLPVLPSGTASPAGTRIISGKIHIHR